MKKKKKKKSPDRKLELKTEKKFMTNRQCVNHFPFEIGATNIR